MFRTEPPGCSGPWIPFHKRRGRRERRFINRTKQCLERKMMATFIQSLNEREFQIYFRPDAVTMSGNTERRESMSMAYSYVYLKS